jgi:hypothetical protein
MWKKDYQSPAYAHGEWRYALRIFHSVNVHVDGLNISSSGGDGIGVSGKDIVIRNCVMDDNHRQGMSIFSVENLLVEKCVMSNTKGTPPQSGIDIEPDLAGERLINVVIRDCLSINNAGHGYELFLPNLRSKSPPVSVTFENCRTFGNGRSLRVVGNLRGNDNVAGTIAFRNCSFEADKTGGLLVRASPADAFDVNFIDCVVSNVMPGVENADVVFSGRGIEHPCVDGVSLTGLKIFQPLERKWFSYTAQGKDDPESISGDVEVHTPGKASRHVKMDAAWVAENMASATGGKPVPPKMGLPDASEITVVDKKPGQTVGLSYCTMLYGPRYVFFMEKPGRAVFSGRQIVAVAGRKPSVKPVTVTAIGKNGRRGKSVNIPVPGTVLTEFTFDAEKRGFYVLEVPADGTRFQLFESSVPVAVDVTEKPCTAAAIAHKPFSLYSYVGERDFAAILAGDGFYRFACRAFDHSGREVFSDGQVDCTRLVRNGKDTVSGIWRFDFSAAPRPNYDWVRFDLRGVPGVVFLSGEKYWHGK